MSGTNDVIKISVPTAIGVLTSAEKQIGVTHKLEDNSTLNELIDNATAVPYQPSTRTVGLQESAPYEEADTPNIETSYLAIGIFGHKSVTGANNIPVNDPVPHLAKHTGLYQIAPYLVRKIDNDIPVSRRSRYRLRKVLLISGQLYVAYYLLKIDKSTAVSELKEVNINNGVKTETVWKPTIQDLTPTHPVIDYTNKSNYLSASVKVFINFTAEELADMAEAMSLLFGKDTYAVTEMALCTGVDKQIISEYPRDGSTSPSGAIVSQNLQEAVGVQTAYLMNTSFQPAAINEEYGFYLEIGSSEPLYGV